MADAADNINVPAAGGGPAKRRRKHRQSTLLPARPKKPMSGYTIFLRNYFNTHPHEAGITSHEMLVRASGQWRNTPDDQKHGYQQLCAADIARYRQAMELWKRQKTALKRPASAYALFVKDHWQAEREAGRLQGGVREMGANCKLAWDQMSDEARQQYHQRYTANSLAYKERIAGVYAGRIRVEDLVNALDNVNNPAPAAADADPNAQADADAGNDDQAEDVDGGDGENNDEEEGPQAQLA